jgi:hypothetical protein
LLDACAEAGVGEVTARVGDAELRCRSSWSLNRVRRWADLADPGQLSGLSESRSLTADELGLSDGPPDASLAW